MEVALAVAGLVIGSASTLLAWLQWQRPRPIREDQEDRADVRGERPAEQVPAVRDRDSAGDGLPPALVTRLIGPFVGRHLELAAIEREWDAVRAGGNGVVSISGEAGVGDEEDLAELVDGLPLGDDAPEVGTELYRRTGGHPFFATSILESIARTGATTSGEHLSRSHVPEDIAEHIALRLARLAPDARNALEVASVIGDEFELALWARVLQRPLDDSLVELVLEVEDSGLAADVSGRAGWLRFSHELVRDAVYLRLTALRRARLHRGVVDGLGGSPELVAVRAHHLYEAAGIYMELRPCSVDASIAAASDGIERMAYGDAVHHYGRALDLAQSDERRALVGAGLGDALWRQGDPVEARHQLERAAAIARELDLVELLAEIATTMSAVAFQSGASDPLLRDLYEEVLALLPEDEVFWRVRLVTALIRETAPRRVSPDLQRRAAPVLRLAANDDDPATRAYAHLIRHDAQLGDLDSSRRGRTAAQIIEAAEAAGDPHLLCEGYGFTVFAALERADLASARDAIAGCERTAERFRSPYARWQAALYRAGLAVFQRPLAEARAAIDHAREIGAALAYCEVEHMHAVQSALLRRELGRVSRVEDIGPEGAESYDLPAWKAAAAVGLCEARGGRQPERAVPLLDELVCDGLDRVPPDRSYPMALAYLAEAYAYLRDRTGAGLVLPFVQACARRHPVIARAAIYCGSTDYHLGLLHATLGRYDAAIACFGTSHTIEARMEAPLWTCHTLVAHAQTLRARDEPGDRQAAGPIETRARTIAEQYGYIRAHQQLDGDTPPQIAAPGRAATTT